MVIETFIFQFKNENQCTLTFLKPMNEAASPSNNQMVTETFKPELEEIKKKGAALNLKGDQRDFFLSIVSRIENNCQVIESLREDHKSLRQKLLQLVKEKESLPKAVDLDKTIKHWNHEVAYLKKQIDQLKNRKEQAINREAELELILANFQSAEVAEHPEIENTRLLKNKLDKAKIKLAETNHLLKVYKAIQYQFDREKMRWTPVIENEDKEIAQKLRDIDDLRLIARESTHSRDIAKMEYNETNKEITNQKKIRDKMLQDKQDYMRSMLHKMPIANNANTASKGAPSLMSRPSAINRSRTTKLQKEKREENLRNASAQMEKIREIFGTTSISQIQNYFKEHEENRISLNEQIEQLKQGCQQCEKEQEKLKTELEELEFVASKGIGSTRIQHEGEKLLTEKRQQLSINKREAEAFKDFQKGVLVGISHLADILQIITKDPKEVPTDPIEILNWVKEKVKVGHSLLDDEDTNYIEIVNQPVLAQYVAAKNSAFDQKTDLIKKIQKRTLEPLRKAPKDTKGDVQTRVVTRDAVKLQARLAVEAKLKKPVPK